MAGDAAQLVAANGLILLAGIGPFRLARGGLPRTLTAVGLAYLLGVACVGVAAQLLLLAGLELSRVQIVVLCLVLLLAGVRGRPRAPRPAGDPVRGWAAAAAALAAAGLVVLAVDLWYQPLAVWDAWQHWTPKARSFVLAGGLDVDLFASPAYVIWNPDYPVLLPALEAIDLRFMGFNTQILHLQFGLLLAGFVLALAELARGRVQAVLLWPVAAMTVWAPSLLIQTASAYADVPLAVFVALAGVCALLWLEQGDRATLALLAAFAAAAVATKMEGMVFAGALFVVTAVLAARLGRRQLLAVGVAAAVAAGVGILPWRAWTIAHDVEGVYSSTAVVDGLSDPGRLASTVERLPLATARLAVETLDPGSWLLIVPLSAAAIALALLYAERREGAVFVLGTAALTLTGLVVLYWLSPFPFEWHLDKSARRIVTAPVLFLAALTPFLLADVVPARRPRQ